MSWKEWKHDLDEANKAYDSGRIEREVYETRIKYALCMIYEGGNVEMAEGIARAHGYDMEKLIFYQPSIRWLVFLMEKNFPPASVPPLHLWSA